MLGKRGVWYVVFHSIPRVILPVVLTLTIGPNQSLWRVVVERWARDENIGEIPSVSGGDFVDAFSLLGYLWYTWNGNR